MRQLYYSELSYFMSIQSATQETGEQIGVIDRSERKNAVILRFTTRANELCDSWIASPRTAKELIELMRSIINLYEKWLKEYMVWFEGYKQVLPEGEKWMEWDNRFTEALLQVIRRIETPERGEKVEKTNGSTTIQPHHMVRDFGRRLVEILTWKWISQHFLPFPKRWGHWAPQHTPEEAPLQ